MKKYVVAAVAVLAIVFMGTQIRLQTGVPFQYYNGTFANSQTDTIHIPLEAEHSTIAFGAHFQDSVNITNVIVRRIVNGEPASVVAGDTIQSAFIDTSVAGYRGTAANPSSSFLKSITIGPKPDEFWVIVAYASSKNGVTNAKVRYEFTQSH